MWQAQAGTRLFVSLSLEGDTSREVLILNKYFHQAAFGRNLHLTLSFIGNVADPLPYKDALNKITAPEFALVLDTFGYFFNTSSSIVWLAPRSSPPLTRIKSHIDASLKTLGFEPEKRKFRPHITLCRLKNTSRPVLAAMLNNVPNIAINWQVNRFSLMKSVPTPAGARHEVVSHYSLGQG